MDFNRSNMSENGQDLRDYKEQMIDEATVFFGKYKGKKILECDDANYWMWVWKECEMYNRLGKYAKKAVRIMAND